MQELLQNSLHTISQWLLIPTMIILLLLMIYTVAALGAVIIEGVRERSVVKENVSDLILNLHGKSIHQIRKMIERSRIYERHKKAFFTIIDHRDNPEELLVAAARRLIADEEKRFDKRASLTESASKIAPMFGLMGTLIPLGPGLLALGQGDTMTLSNSLIVAFDTTVAGLISAAVCYVIAKIRRRWYDDYMVSMETIMDAVLEEVSSEREETEELEDAESSEGEKAGAADDEESSEGEETKSSEDGESSEDEEAEVPDEVESLEDEETVDEAKSTGADDSGEMKVSGSGEAETDESASTAKPGEESETVESKLDEI